jgi:YHS domain-containing protein
MKKPITTVIIYSSLFLIACGNSTNQSSSAVVSDSPLMNTTDTVTQKTYNVAILDNKKDPTCGMPVTAGITDTTHFQNKVIGFCSTECKAEFLKNPQANIAAAALK